MPLQTTVAIASLLAAAMSPTADSTGPWGDRYGDAGSVHVPADRRTITVCDNSPRDDLRFKADYMTKNELDPTVYTVLARQGSCESDRTYISRIKVFKLCSGRPGIGDTSWVCHTPIWTH